MDQSRQKKAVLIVEPAEEIRVLIKEALSKVDAKLLVIEADDGLKAEQKIEKQKFDLVVSDIAPPKRELAQILKSIRGLDAKGRPENILIFSESPFDEKLRALYSEGVFHYLKRPCTLDDLVRRFQEVFQSSGKGDEKTLGKEFMRVFEEAAKMVFSVTASTIIEKEYEFVRGKDQMGGDISAVLGLEGDSLHGSLLISFDEATFLTILKNMLERPFEKMLPEYGDLSGEVCNQILGISKKSLSQRGYQVKGSLPMVVLGKNHEIRHAVNAPAYAVRFKTNGGSFILEACIERKPGT